VKRQTKAQKRILDLLADGKPHALASELETMGHQNQWPAIQYLEKRGAIEKVVDGGYYSYYRLRETKA